MEITLTFTQEELDVVAAGLGELPHKYVADLVSNIQTQINGQLKDVEEITEKTVRS